MFPYVGSATLIINGAQMCKCKQTNSFGALSESPKSQPNSTCAGDGRSSFVQNGQNVIHDVTSSDMASYKQQQRA